MTKKGLQPHKWADALKKYGTLQVVEEVTNPEREIQVDEFLGLPVYVAFGFAYDSEIITDSRIAEVGFLNLYESVYLPWTLYKLPDAFLEYVGQEYTIKQAPAELISKVPEPVNRDAEHRVTIKAGRYEFSALEKIYLKQMSALDYNSLLNRSSWYDFKNTLVIKEDFTYTPISTAQMSSTPNTKHVWEEGEHEFVYLDGQNAKAFIHATYEQAKLKLTGGGSILAFVIAKGVNTVHELYPTNTVASKTLGGDE